MEANPEFCVLFNFVLFVFFFVFVPFFCPMFFFVGKHQKQSHPKKKTKKNQQKLVNSNSYLPDGIDWRFKESHLIYHHVYKAKDEEQKAKMEPKRNVYMLFALNRSLRSDRQIMLRYLKVTPLLFFNFCMFV